MLLKFHFSFWIVHCVTCRVYITEKNPRNFCQKYKRLTGTAKLLCLCKNCPRSHDHAHLHACWNLEPLSYLVAFFPLFSLSQIDNRRTNGTTLNSREWKGNIFYVFAKKFAARVSWGSCSLQKNQALPRPETKITWHPHIFHRVLYCCKAHRGARMISSSPHQSYNTRTKENEGAKIRGKWLQVCIDLLRFEGACRIVKVLVDFSGKSR